MLGFCLLLYTANYFLTIHNFKLIFAVINEFYLLKNIPKSYLNILTITIIIKNLIIVLTI